MRASLVALAALTCMGAETPRYELGGQIVPEQAAAVYLHGATTPFAASTLADSRGRFRFRDILAGDYTIAVFIPTVGETRQTIEVGPSGADARRRVSVKIVIAESQVVRDERHAKVSTRELSIPDRARREYENAQKKLNRRDVPGAIAHLERAVELAPQFSEAWNNLGTIAYQSRQYAKAEDYFRRALEQDKNSYAPLVNLGGALLSEGKLDEALQYNLYAVLSRPNDSLANSQLGMTYFAVGNLDLGQKYLEIAKRLDPAHFSQPQKVLAEIHLRRGERAEAAAELEEFLRYHPDAPEAPKLREAIAKLREH